MKKGTIFKQELYKALPKDLERRLGYVKETYNAYKPLDLADWQAFGYEKDKEEVRYMAFLPSVSSSNAFANDHYTPIAA